MLSAPLASLAVVVPMLTIGLWALFGDGNPWRTIVVVAGAAFIAWALHRAAIARGRRRAAAAYLAARVALVRDCGHDRRSGVASPASRLARDVRCSARPRPSRRPAQRRTRR